MEDHDDRLMSASEQDKDDRVLSQRAIPKAQAEKSEAEFADKLDTDMRQSEPPTKKLKAKSRDNVM